MAKYEYTVYTQSWGHGASTDTIVAELNQRGEKGWELVGMTRDESPEDNHDDEVVMFVFKRALAAKKKGKKKGKGKKKKK